jgi:hypothetical protein
MRLHRLAMLAAVVVAAPLVTVASQGAADAATTCTLWGPHDGGLYTRNCEIDSSRIGGRIHGSVFWDYKQSSGRGNEGDATLQINDRTGDGHCTTLKIKYRGGPAGTDETVTRQACGGDQYGPHHFTLNVDEGGAWGLHSTGNYSIESCTGGASTCVQLWYQKVGQTPPT